MEDIAEAQAAGRAPPSVPSASSPAAAAGLSPPAANATAGSAPPPPAEDPPVIQAYDEEVAPLIGAFVKLSGELSPVLKEQVRYSV